MPLASAIGASGRVAVGLVGDRLAACRRRATTWTPRPPSARVVGFVGRFAELALADVAASAWVSASLTSARIGVAVRA